MIYGLTLKGLTSALSLAALLLGPLYFWVFGFPSFGSTKPEPLPPPLSMIQSKSELMTTQVHVQDVIEGENNHWKGRWTLHGELFLGVDLAQASYVKTLLSTKEVIISLPQPHVIATKVDHERSEERFLQSKSWFGFSDPTEFRLQVWKQADRKLEKLGQEMGYRERAKVQAERVLETFLKGMGWTARFEWKA